MIPHALSVRFLSSRKEATAFNCELTNACCLEPAPPDSSYETVKPKPGFWKEAAVRFAHILVGGPLFGCAYTPPFQPKDDYARYPGYEKDIALHNIAGILKESCGEYSVSHQGLYCTSRRCPGGLVKEMVSGGITTCTGGWDEVESRFSWDEVGGVEVGERGCVRVKDVSGNSNLGNSIFGCTIYVFLGDHVVPLKNAIEQYLQHR